MVKKYSRYYNNNFLINISRVELMAPLTGIIYKKSCFITIGLKIFCFKMEMVFLRNVYLV